MGGQNEIEQEIEFQPLNGTLVPFNGTPPSRVVNVTKFTRTFIHQHLVSFVRV